MAFISSGSYYISTRALVTLCNYCKYTFFYTITRGNLAQSSAFVREITLKSLENKPFFGQKGPRELVYIFLQKKGSNKFDTIFVKTGILAPVSLIYNPFIPQKMPFTSLLI